MFIRSLRRSALFGLALAGVISTATACGSKQDGAPSALAIRGGRPVAPAATGPERRSTVGLFGIVGGNTYTCSAAPIGSKLLVTAAHCFPEGARVAAFFGLDFNDVRDADPVIRVARGLAHPDFVNSEEGRLPPHDIALLELANELPRGIRVANILPAGVELEKDESVLLAGYGETEVGRDGGELRWTISTYAGQDAEGGLLIEDTQRRGACRGDSGGPLFVQRGQEWYIGGVLSGGPIPCRGINTYTSLVAHADFIANATRLLR